jgi:hypothetical protein
MVIRELGNRSLRRAAWVGLMTAVGLLAGVATAGAQLGSRTFGNSALALDAGRVGDQLSISSSDRTAHKMELTRELQYLDAAKWQAASVTWLRFRQAGDGEILVTEMGPGVVQEVKASKKWQIEPTEGGGWKLSSDKAGGKLDLYLETVFNGNPFSVGAVVPKFDGDAYGAVYRGRDFLFFVVQKKHPEPAAAG